MRSVFLKKFTKEMRAPDSLWRNKAFICLAVVIAYASVWPNKFVFDDDILIQANSFLKTPQGLLKIFTHLNGEGAGWHAGFYRPVPMVFHFFIYWFSYPLHSAFHMPMTLGFHALNIILQALNGCLLLDFAVRAGFNKNAGLAAALLWAVHPLHTEAVTYMSATPELMWSTFCLLGLITLLPKETPAEGHVDMQKAFTTRRIALSLIPFTLAMLSKESAVVFPALAAGTLFFISPDRTRFSIYSKTWPLWLLSFCAITIIVFFLLGHKMGGPLNPAYVHVYESSMAVRIWTALSTLPTYARLMVWPEGLYFRREAHIYTSLWNWHSLLGLAMVLAALLQIILGRGKKGLGLSFGFIWFAAAQAPNTGIVAPIDAVISEHWMYLPTMGLFLGIAQALSPLFQSRRRATVLVIAILVVFLGVTTFQQNKKWRNMNTLYQNTAQHGGSLIEMRSNEAIFLMSHHLFKEARQQLDIMIKVLPKNRRQERASAQMTMGLAWLQVVPEGGWALNVAALRRALPHARHIDKAIAALKEATRIDPHYYWAHKFLAMIYAHVGDKKHAAEEDKIAKQLKPKDE